VLVVAVVSNLCQYFIGNLRWEESGFALEWGPDFGGLSGVLYGLVGYRWARGHWEPESGLGLPPQALTLLLLWFFACWTNLLGPVANVAHTAGLLLGLAIGSAPAAWRALRGGR
jgi:GlpG protein